ncbi:MULTISPECIES: sulfite-sensing transcriptional repressor BigR [unclassified Rhizobium]|uniref:sulfite-sensing transcriptional repressor BigR n=1 Tax=unclassified Rhizobium TaxID=2613769 RepID=UPI001ADC2575|nr:MULTISPECIES: sulfite-sensing transcriptional repressor BigR [unclassified Rhizobium]MBO9099807.1 helix-turn-helix transcriptional regulator [Rhizobium sp. L58/93]MBO9131651.1 helix-turn-helix transcriptional regulator [Rhizobium sp. B209b/85]MBO9169796.1 helix-turn-helix transcriptional regulator [Rhizobium sp. L245/93]MBO9185754.1 helix-turn-helix transcriptional regulator [Rhizobium sp. E27B/91]QXZ82517.1 helix-turn-helix transcriptional regulator [Rhizobium sp. K1/93]
MTADPDKSAAPALTPQDMAARAATVAGLMKTLAHPARLMIVCTLVEGERSVGELEVMLDLHQPHLSQQLTVLREAEIVATRREGKQIFYSLTEEKAAQLVGALYEIFCKPEAGQ